MPLLSSGTINSGRSYGAQQCWREESPPGKHAMGVRANLGILYLVPGSTAVPIQRETRLYRADWMEPVVAAATVQHKHELSSWHGYICYPWVF